MRISDWSSDVCSSDLENAGAIAGLIACHLASGDVAGAREMFDGLDDKMRADPAFASVDAQLALQDQAADSGEIPVLMAPVGARPEAHQAHFAIAHALHAAGHRKDAAHERLARVVTEHNAVAHRVGEEDEWKRKY